jgi:hypothetical protein
MSHTPYQVTETDDHNQSLQLIEIDDQTSSTSDQEQNSDDAADGITDICCKICGVHFVHGQSRRHHTRTKEHQAALKEFKKKEAEEAGHDKRTEATSVVPEVPKTAARSKEKVEIEPVEPASDVTAKAVEHVVAKQKYRVRSGKKLPEQNQLYINTLTAFFTLRYALGNVSKDLQVSINDVNWKDFGDIVMEVTNRDVTEVHAVQCRQIQTRNNITISALSAEKGKFSIKKLCKTLKELRNKRNYEKTYFKLFTVSNLLVEKDNNPKFTYDERIVEKGKNDNEKMSRSDRTVIIPQYKKNNLLNSTDDPDDICIFKILNHEDEDLNDDLNKFSLFTNQKKLFGLRELIKMMIEDKFDNSKDISNDVIKYIGEYFRTSQTVKEDESYYKLTKTDILVKVAELLLQSNLVLPEGVIGESIEEIYLKLWKDTAEVFDIIIIKNDSDIVNKLYVILNKILEPEIGCTLNFSTKLTVNKKDIKSEALTVEIFDGLKTESVIRSCKFMYFALWKTGLVPLILTAETEKHLSSIIKVISFLKSEDISLKFILMTDLQIDQSYFPENLNVFFNLEDLKAKAPSIWPEILNSISIEVLDFSVKLKEIVDLNDDYLGRLRPDALLNMFLKDYSFRDVDVPITGDIVDNILVFKDDAVNSIRQYFQRRDGEQNADELSYLVNIKGCPTLIQVPPEL